MTEGRKEAGGDFQGGEGGKRSDGLFYCCRRRGGGRGGEKKEQGIFQTLVENYTGAVKS